MLPVSSNHPRHLLFVQSVLRMGGLETLLLRLGRHLSRNGVRVSVVTADRKPSAISTELARFARIQYLPSFEPHRARLGLGPLQLADVDCVYCFDSSALLIGLLLREAGKLSAPVVAGVYHPGDYRPPRTYVSYVHMLRARAFRGMPSSNVVFMSQECRDAHVKYYGDRFQDCPIVPIPIDVMPLDRQRKVRAGKIVSVGRIVDFKRYHFALLEVLPSLRSRHPSVEYHVYGSGQEFPELQEEVRRRGMGRYVKLHGDLPYADFRRALSDAQVFVGMGTAAIEAAAMGLPTLLAPYRENRPLTYGHFGDIPGYAAGELIPDWPLVPYERLLDEILSASAPEYEALAARGAARASRFSMDQLAPRLLDVLANAERELPPGNGSLVLGFIDEGIRTLLGLAWTADRRLRRGRLASAG